ncbi:MAG: AraC family transcriptional regulator [Crocinitomicaceae bacterium]|nr:AraC family transcriptional regulator [Crocinitomicaceae bacterium]
METIFLLGTVQAIFLALILLGKKNKMLADKILGAWLLFLGVHLFSHYLFITNSLENYPIFHAASVGFPMLEGAFIFIYIRAITNKIQRLNWKYFIHLSHYFVLTVLLFIVVFANDELTIKESVLHLQKDPTVLIFLFGILNVFLGPIYLILSLVLLLKHRKNIRRDFSYTEDINLKWLFYLVAIMGLVWIIVVLVNVLAKYINVIDPNFGDNIIYVALTIAIFFIGYFGIKQQVIYSPSAKKEEKETVPNAVDEKPIQPDTDRYKKSGLKKEESTQHANRLKEYMQEERPYLNGKLSLKETADYLEISVNHLSQVINEQMEVNFFDFINSYRVEEVKRLLADPEYKQYTLLAVAYDSGFNSKSSFNNIFKKFTGLTPTNYINQ